MDEWKKNASHIDFNFPDQPKQDVKTLLPHVSEDCCDILEKLLAYHPDERYTSTQAKNHIYFRD